MSKTGSPRNLGSPHLAAVFQILSCGIALSMHVRASFAKPRPLCSHLLYIVIADFVLVPERSLFTLNIVRQGMSHPTLLENVFCLTEHMYKTIRSTCICHLVYVGMYTGSTQNLAKEFTMCTKSIQNYCCACGYLACDMWISCV